MTPRWRWSGARVAILLYAPRNLKAPPRWNCSHLSHTDCPALASKLLPVTTGVRCALPASLSAALHISSKVVGNVVLVCTGSLAMCLLPLLSHATTIPHRGILPAHTGQGVLRYGQGFAWHVYALY